MRRGISFAILYIMLTMFTGCYDSRELSNSAYVAMIGVDEGVSDIWRITFLIPTFGKTEGTSGGEEGNSDKGNHKIIKYTIEAPSFFEGISLANTNIAKEIFLIHANTIVFSEDLARKGKVGEFIAPLIRNREIRRTEFIIVSKDSAKSFLEAAASEVETTITKEMENLMANSLNTGFFPKTTLNELNNGLKSTYRQVMATYGAINSGLNKNTKGSYDKDPKKITSYYAGDIPREDGSKIDLAGSAIIDGDKMIGKLTNHETCMVLIAKNQIKRVVFSIPDPKASDSIVPVEVRMSKKPKVKVKFEDEEPIIDLDLRLDGDILSIQSRIDYEEPKLTPVLEKAVAEFIKRELDHTIKKCKGFKSDVFGFGNVGVRKFATIQEWEKYNWNEHFENADINITVEFKIKRTGSMISDSPIISSEGKEKDKE